VAELSRARGSGVSDGGVRLSDRPSEGHTPTCRSVSAPAWVRSSFGADVLACPRAALAGMPAAGVFAARYGTRVLLGTALMRRVPNDPIRQLCVLAPTAAPTAEDDREYGDHDRAYEDAHSVHGVLLSSLKDAPGKHPRVEAPVPREAPNSTGRQIRSTAQLARFDPGDERRLWRFGDAVWGRSVPITSLRGCVAGCLESGSWRSSAERPPARSR
jgi:hypothetical protein